MIKKKKRKIALLELVYEVHNLGRKGHSWKNIERAVRAAIRNDPYRGLCPLVYDAARAVLHLLANPEEGAEAD